MTILPLFCFRIANIIFLQEKLPDKGSSCIAILAKILQIDESSTRRSSEFEFLGRFRLQLPIVTLVLGKLKEYKTHPANKQDKK